MNDTLKKLDIVKEKYTVMYPELIDYENKRDNTEHRPLRTYIAYNKSDLTKIPKCLFYSMPNENFRSH